MDILETAAREKGVTSDVGGKPNPRLYDYCAKLGLRYEKGLDEVWCALFVGFVLETCGYPSTRALNARSYLGWGEAVRNPVQGDVVVFWRDSIASPNGHVSFFHHEDENTVYCLGGNQGSGIVDVEAYPRTRVLGYRRAITTNQNTHMDTHNESQTEAENPVIAPKASTVPNTRYAEITSVTQETDKGTTDVAVVRFDTDDANVASEKLSETFTSDGLLTLEEAVELVKAKVEPGEAIEVITSL